MKSPATIMALNSAKRRHHRRNDTDSRNWPPSEQRLQSAHHVGKVQGYSIVTGTGPWVVSIMVTLIALWSLTESLFF